MCGQRTGSCKGLGGSRHIAAMALDISGCTGIIGAGAPHACGAALSARLRGTDQVAVAFFGGRLVITGEDGAIDIVGAGLGGSDNEAAALEGGEKTQCHHRLAGTGARSGDNEAVSQGRSPAARRHTSRDPGAAR